MGSKDKGSIDKILNDYDDQMSAVLEEKSGLETLVAQLRARILQLEQALKDVETEAPAGDASGRAEKLISQKMYRAGTEEVGVNVPVPPPFPSATVDKMNEMGLQDLLLQVQEGDSRLKSSQELIDTLVCRIKDLERDCQDLDEEIGVMHDKNKKLVITNQEIMKKTNQLVKTNTWLEEEYKKSRETVDKVCISPTCNLCHTICICSLFYVYSIYFLLFYVFLLSIFC